MRVVKGVRMGFEIFCNYQYIIYTVLSQASQDNIQVFRSSFHVFLSVV